MDGMNYSTLHTLLLTPMELKSEKVFLGNSFANTFATCILDAKYVISTILPSTKLTFCLISNATFSISYQKTIKYLMAPWESTLIKRITLALSLELNQCTTMLTQSLMSIDRPLKRNSTTWLSLIFLNHAGPLGIPGLLYSKKRWPHTSNYGLTFTQQSYHL